MVMRTVQHLGVSLQPAICLEAKISCRSRLQLRILDDGTLLGSESRTQTQFQVSERPRLSFEIISRICEVSSSLKFRVVCEFKLMMFLILISGLCLGTNTGCSIDPSLFIDDSEISSFYFCVVYISCWLDYHLDEARLVEFEAKPH